MLSLQLHNTTILITLKTLFMDSSAVNQTWGSCNGSLAGQGMFAAKCSHSLFLPSGHCPICTVTWNPFQRAFDDDPPQFFDDELLLVDHKLVDPTPDVNSTEVVIKAVPERPAVAASESVSLFTLLVRLKAPPLSEDAKRASVDIVTVLDVSASMRGRKLDLVKRAVHFVIDNLGFLDRLSIVAFSDEAKRLLPLRRMTESGRENAHKVVDELVTLGGTNIVKGLVKGAKVLDERRLINPVSSIIFLSDGNDTNNTSNQFGSSRNAPTYLNLLPASLYPKNGGELGTIPVHSFGFGSDHDPVTMHAISDASGGTFSFIGSIEMVQDAFARCIGGLLSVVSQEVCLNLRSASHGVEIKRIPSGRYPAKIFSQGTEAIVNIGDLYADEEKEFLISLSVPKNEGEIRNTTLLDITCSYKDAVSKNIVQVEGNLVGIGRPEMVSPQDMVINMEVDRQRNRLYAAESIKEAHQMAETGNLEGATKLLAKKREDVFGSASAKAGDSLTLWLGAEMKDTEMLMGSSRIYQESGRAFALSGMSSHAAQRATTKAVSGLGAPIAMGTPASGFGSCTFGAPAAGFSFGSSTFDAPAAGSGFGSWTFGAPAEGSGQSSSIFGDPASGSSFGSSTFGAPAAGSGFSSCTFGAPAAGSGFGSWTSGAPAAGSGFGSSTSGAPAAGSDFSSCTFGASAAGFGGYVTPNMTFMVNKSQQLNKKQDNPS
ncbi:hypothetical protein ACS0TY_000659 [Phlomoides rotata]